MAEETVQNDAPETTEDTPAPEQTAPEAQGSGRPNLFAFATLLFGGWAALMIVLTLIAVVAMTLVGMVAG